MAQPTSRQLHVDALLTNVSIGYTNAQYIADQIFPRVPVQKQSDIVPNFDQSHWFRDEAAIRAPGTSSERGGFSVNNTNKYFCDRYSYGYEIADETRDNADAPYNLDIQGTKFVTDKLMMRREVAFATDFFTTGVWGTDKVGGTDFVVYSDYANSSPLVDFTTYEDSIEGKIGRPPNTFVLGKLLWSQLKWHPDVVDSIKYTQTGIVDSALFARLIDIEKVLIGRSIYTTNAEGTAEGSVTYSRIWGKHGLLLYVPANPSLFEPAAGYCFVWERVAGAAQYMKRIRNEEREIDIIEGNSYFDQTKTAGSAGLFLSGAAA